MVDDMVDCVAREMAFVSKKAWRVRETSMGKEHPHMHACNPRGFLLIYPIGIAWGLKVTNQIERAPSVDVIPLWNFSFLGFLGYVTNSTECFCPSPWEFPKS